MASCSHVPLDAHLRARDTDAISRRHPDGQLEARTASITQARGAKVPRYKGGQYGARRRYLSPKDLRVRWWISELLDACRTVEIYIMCCEAAGSLRLVQYPL